MRQKSHSAEAAKEDLREPRWTEVLKKLIAVGVSGAVLSEEVIRSSLGEVKLPKDLLNLFVIGAQKSKEEVAQRLAREVSNLLSKVDLIKEFSRFAETHKFRISAEIEVIPRGHGYAHGSSSEVFRNPATSKSST